MPVKTEAKKLSTSAYSSYVDTKLPFLQGWGGGGVYTFFNLSFLANILVEAPLVILSIP